jgi:hypothetical protein
MASVCCRDSGALRQESRRTIAEETAHATRRGQWSTGMVPELTQRDVGDKWHDGLMNTTPADTRLGIHADFGSLLGGLSGRTTDLAQLPHLLFEHGRVLVQASAGLGKSALLRDLADLLKVGGTSVGIVALRELERDRRVWTEQDDAEMWIVDHLPQNGQPFVLLLDGLDEVPHRDGQRLLDAIEHVTRGSPEVAVVATDRLGRRSLRLNRWLLVSLSSRREALDAVSAKESSEQRCGSSGADRNANVVGAVLGGGRRLAFRNRCNCVAAG